MVFDQEQLQQLNTLFKEQAHHFDDKLDEQRLGIMADMRVVLNVELREIKKTACTAT